MTFDPRYAAGQLVVLPRAHFLYLVTGPGRARRYGVGVGRAGLDFTGTATIAVKKKWPTWRPTDEMIEREPQTYARFKGNDYVQPGGPDNPLGSRALYLFQNGRDTYYRIHGTNAPSVDRAVGVQRLHPDDQRACAGSLRARAGRHRRHGAVTARPLRDRSAKPVPGLCLCP